MGPPVGGDRVNRRVVEGLAAEALAEAGLEAVEDLAVDLVAAAERSEVPWACLRAVVFLDVAAECRGLLRDWAGHQAVWAVLAACQGRRQEWVVAPVWRVTRRE
jgi:hypothetical protein